ncbi:MAG: Crp/Fnr family transcriptional regulator [Gammaproteobacteria bacterium]|nr:Crp/Fnr family transcriptional regulator [Gammaproteobacteria bacterium]
MVESLINNSLTELLKQKSFEYISSQSQTVTVPANSSVFRQGDACKNYLLVIEGSVKVFSRAENGREVILYRVQDGQSCTLTTACLFADNPYPAEGLTEIDTIALMIPLPIFNRALAESEEFRKIIFDQYAQRLSDVINLVENLSFGHINIRLARLLLQLSKSTDIIETTHHILATELGSAREVISRQLKQFEKKQIISLQRGSITVINKQALLKIAD